MPSAARSQSDPEILRTASQAAFKRSKAGRNKGVTQYQMWGMGFGALTLIGSFLVLLNPPKTFIDTFVNDNGLIYQIKRSNAGWTAGPTPMFDDMTLGDAKRLSFSQVILNFHPTNQVLLFFKTIPSTLCQFYSISIDLFIFDSSNVI